MLDVLNQCLVSAPATASGARDVGLHLWGFIYYVLTILRIAFAGPTREAIEAKDVARYTDALSLMARGKLDEAEDVFLDLLKSSTITSLQRVSKFLLRPI